MFYINNLKVINFNIVNNIYYCSSCIFILILNKILKNSQIAIRAADARPGRFTGGERIDCAIAELDIDKRKAVLSIKLLDLSMFIFNNYNIEYVSAFALSKHNLKRGSSIINIIQNIKI